MKSLEFYLKTHCKGKENAVKSPDLEAIFYCKGTEIRQMVNECRCRGVPICSGSTGYYYATEEKEIERTIANLSSRIKNIEAARNGLQSLINKNHRSK